MENENNLLRSNSFILESERDQLRMEVDKLRLDVVYLKDFLKEASNILDFYASNGYYETSIFDGEEYPPPILNDAGEKARYWLESYDTLKGDLIK